MFYGIVILANLYLFPPLVVSCDKRDENGNFKSFAGENVLKFSLNETRRVGEMLSDEIDN